MPMPNAVTHGQGNIGNHPFPEYSNNSMLPPKKEKGVDGRGRKRAKISPQ
eukprot:CAMPEP_0116914466 /NCGR_PEP_ID=MMETSP0467-20121206/17345_1 /TAXON_ID=283647 /ORGANISM="Mesodinium pulex, Strain SPMC105" /LENGTH=49 /DNA_ID=CAMNT_0004590935 /DNA_START=339 /DNA_END=488 /DNA_ORIENTATION=+